MKPTILLLFLFSTVIWAGNWESFPLRKNGSIVVWTVAGPFPNGKPTFHGEGCFGYFTDYLTTIGGECQAIPVEGDRVVYDEDKQVMWKTVFSDSAGMLDYIDIFSVDRETPGVAYAFCQLQLDKSQKVVLKIRSNDGVRAWLNQEMIHDHHVGRLIDAEEDRVQVKLKKGDNRLLVKVDQGAGNWGLGLSVVGLDGKPPKGLTSSVAPKMPLKGKIKTAKFAASPLVMKTPQGERQVINAEIVSAGLQSVICKISKDEWPQPQKIRLGDLPPGKHSFKIKVPAISESGPAQVTLQSSTDQLELNNVLLEKPRKWMVYLVQHVHTDIGYTKPQTEILPEHLRYIDYALDYCDLTDDYPDDAKFRFTCEVSWAVREYLKRRPIKQIERLKRRVAEGRIEIAGMFLNMSEIATESAMAASLQPIRTFKEMGLPVRTAMQNDVNGAAWCLVDYFSDIGVKYLTMGINKTRSLLPFDKPTAFWWESPSGKRLLAFRPDHYHTGNSWKIHEGNLKTFEPGIMEYLSLLQEKNYPFDRIAVQYSGFHTDNSPPAMIECDLVKEWNEIYAWPKLRSATAHEFLQYVEKHHADELLVYRTAWPDWWTDGFGSAARETAASRETHVAMQVNDGLFSIASLLGVKIPSETMDRVAGV